MRCGSCWDQSRDPELGRTYPGWPEWARSPWRSIHIDLVCQPRTWISPLKLSVPLLPTGCFCEDSAGDPWLGLNDSGIQWSKFWPEILNYPWICGLTWSLSCTWLFSEAHCYHFYNFSNACLQKIIIAGPAGCWRPLTEEWTKRVMGLSPE